MANMDDILPSAKDNLRKSAEMEAQKAAEFMKKRQAAEVETKELPDKLSKPSGVSDEERKKRSGRGRARRRPLNSTYLSAIS